MTTKQVRQHKRWIEWNKRVGNTCVDCGVPVCHKAVRCRKCQVASIRKSLMIRPDGYVAIGHQRVHRIIAERVLGRPLKTSECVHHINGNKSDNRNSNLLICTNSYHRWLESKMADLYKQEHFA